MREVIASIYTFVSFSRAGFSGESVSENCARNRREKGERKIMRKRWVERFLQAICLCDQNILEEKVERSRKQFVAERRTELRHRRRRRLNSGWSQKVECRHQKRHTPVPPGRLSLLHRHPFHLFFSQSFRFRDGTTWTLLFHIRTFYTEHETE